VILKKKAITVAFILFMVALVFFALAYPIYVNVYATLQEQSRADEYTAIGATCLIISLGIAAGKIVQWWANLR